MYFFLTCYAKGPRNYKKLEEGCILQEFTIKHSRVKEQFKKTLEETPYKSVWLSYK